MHADAYGDSDEEWESDSDSDQEAVERLWGGSNLETDQASWSARADLESLVELASRHPGFDAAARLQLIKDVEAAAQTCIFRGDTARFGTATYRGDMIQRIMLTSANQLRALIVSDPRLTGHTDDSLSAIKGQLLRFLAAYVDHPFLKRTLRTMNAEQLFSVSRGYEGAFEMAVSRYVTHLDRLPSAFAEQGVLDDVTEFENISKDSRRIDALRVLHHLKWDPPVRDEWLSPYNGRDLDLEEYGALDAGSGDRLIPDTQERVEFLLDTLGVEATDEAVSAATEPDVYGEVLVSLEAVLANFKVWHERYSGFDEYEALSNDDETIPFPFGKEVVQMWGLANYMDRVPEQLVAHLTNPVAWTELPALDREPERLQRYELMRDRLTRLVWLGVTWWVGRPYPQNNDSATPDEMEHFFWAYVAPEYETNDDALDDNAHVIFKYEELEDLEKVTIHNDFMQDQWRGDRRTGPWFRNLGEFRARTPPGTPPRARDGGETPDARRQRRE